MGIHREEIKRLIDEGGVEDKAIGFDTDGVSTRDIRGFLEDLCGGQTSD